MLADNKCNKINKKNIKIRNEKYNSLYRWRHIKNNWREIITKGQVYFLFFFSLLQDSSDLNGGAEQAGD